jgi:hypothetical protein
MWFEEFEEAWIIVQSGKSEEFEVQNSMNQRTWNTKQ